MRVFAKGTSHLSTKVKMRSDYHDFPTIKVTPSSSSSTNYRWIIPIICLTLGFALGQIYNKKEFGTELEQTKDQLVKGAVKASKASKA